MSENESQSPASTQVTLTPPILPSWHSYLSLSCGVLLPLLIAFVIWQRLQDSDFFYSRLFWSFLWTYPLMLIGCILGEAIARQIGADFYASIGDNPSQMSNLFAGWIWAHLYLILLVALFLYFRMSAKS